MQVNGRAMRTIWSEDGGETVSYIDQRKLPFSLQIRRTGRWEDLVHAIRTLEVRGAPLIGCAGAWAAALALADAPDDKEMLRRFSEIESARPTAVNLSWTLARMKGRVLALRSAERHRAAVQEAQRMAEEDVRTNRAIGRCAAEIFRSLQRKKKGRPLQILTHCNAGWLATVDFGTALSGIYTAFGENVPLHVWVDETRPRLQGLLTVWELERAGVPVTLVADNAGGHLMQHGLVDVVVVGADRITRRGDVANKVGTYLKALAARANGVPFYVAAPFSTIDFTLHDGVRSIPIEERGGDELRLVQGVADDGVLRSVRIAPKQTRVCNPAFDVTPSELVTGIVTERGVLAPGDLAAAGGA